VQFFLLMGHTFGMGSTDFVKIAWKNTLEGFWKIFKIAQVTGIKVWNI
jgi:hypothetical protein